MIPSSQPPPAPLTPACDALAAFEHLLKNTRTPWPPCVLEAMSDLKSILGILGQLREVLRQGKALKAADPGGSGPLLEKSGGKWVGGLSIAKEPAPPPPPEVPPPDLSPLLKMQQVQGREGNWNSSEYMLGLYNGLELARAALEEDNPKLRERPEVWVESVMTVGESRFKKPRKPAPKASDRFENDKEVPFP